MATRPHPRHGLRLWSVPRHAPALKPVDSGDARYAREPADPRVPVEAPPPGRATRAARLADLLAIAALLIGLGAAQPHLFAAKTLVSLDSATQFLPWYAYLGQNLRAGHVPGWNPYAFSGTPFIANPLSGWTYLPAMLLFTALPLPEAAHVYLIVHPLLAACATFAFARLLGLNRTGAVVAGIAYADTGFVQVQNLCCFAFASVYEWLPLTLVGAELAIRAGSWRTRLVFYGITGVAVGQILAAWLGQGAYYALLLLGGYVVFRTLTSGGRMLSLGLLRTLFVHILGVFTFGAALSAAGLLPRMEFNALSNLAGGYTGAEASVGGVHPHDWLLLTTPGFWYAGVTVLGLAVAAPFLRRGYPVSALWYLGGFSLLAVSVTGTVQTPIHWLLYHLLPGFARLHPHAPERILTVAYLGPALLAGLSVTALTSATGKHLLRAVLVLVVIVDLAQGGARARADFALTDPLNGADKLTPVDLNTYYQPDAGAMFLQLQQTDGPPFRYVGYAPYLDGLHWPYSTRFHDPATAALEVDNRGLSLGLEDVQGYDASHLGRFDAYLFAPNGRDQNYHDAEVFRAGLASPLLDLLGVRYVIVPSIDYLDREDQAALARLSAPLYEDARIRILGNSAAFPRAWLVHAAQQLPTDAALAALVAGRVDARAVALVEVPPPLLAAPDDPALDEAVVTADNPDLLTVRTVSTAPGLLMLGEIYYPAWRAFVDDAPVSLYAADGALRAVSVPAGTHSVTLRYESFTLWLGSLISLAALALLIGASVVAALAQVRLAAASRSRKPCAWWSGSAGARSMTTVSDGKAALDALYWRAEILQAMFLDARRRHRLKVSRT